MRGFRSLLVLAIAVVATTLTGTLTAAASPSTVAGTASAGSAHVVRNGHTFAVPAVGPCGLTGSAHGSSQGVTEFGIVTYGPASSTCSTDQTAHTSKVVANGTGVTVSALQSYGGPQIKIAGYQVSCSATTGGTNAAWQFSGLTGITVPQQIPNNYTVPVKSTNGSLLANVVLNEVILPNPNDGSITLNMMHVVLFPNGTPTGMIPMSGDIYVGSTACSPTV